MGENIGQGWSKHMSRSQNKPYLFHHQQNKRYWTEENLPSGWCFEWNEGNKLYRNVLTNVTQTAHPSTTTTTSTTTTNTELHNKSPTSKEPSANVVQDQADDQNKQPVELEPEEGQEDGEEEEEEEEEGYGDERLGYPTTKPTVPTYSHGWCFKPQKFGLAQVCTKDTMCVVELGSYLGNSAKAIAEYAPNAQIYCVDRWNYDFIKQYQADQYQDYELDIMKKHPLYETFLVNTWDLQEKEIDDEGNCAGIVPMRMDTVEALTYLSENGAYPDVIYIDGDHSTTAVKRELEAALQFFPEAIILGNDYRNPTVQSAVDGVASIQKPEPVPVYTDSYSMIWILNSQLEEGNYNEVKLVEDAESEIITKCYQRLARMITSGCTRQELAHELTHTDRKKFVPYLNHCAKKNKGRTLLMHASAEGHSTGVELLADPNGSFCALVNIQGHNNDYTALHYAAYNGHTKCAKALLRYGAKCTLVNKYDETPIQSAHSRGHISIENGLKMWLEKNPENKIDVGMSNALKEHTKKGHGLSKGSSSTASSKNSNGKRNIEELDNVDLDNLDDMDSDDEDDEDEDAKKNEKIEIEDDSEPKKKRRRKE